VVSIVCAFQREEDISDTIHSRIGWLIFFFFGLLVSTMVVEQFEELLRKQVALSYFVPLLIGHGGNSGSQTVTTVIR
jgi:Mg/Co/Ni transporter MgtE